MAPNGPRAGSAPATTRTTRSGGMRGSGPAGVHKRRGGTPRIDRDGDLDMGASSSANGAARGGGNTSRGGRSAPRGAQMKAVQGVLRNAAAEAGLLPGRASSHPKGRSGPTTIIKVLGLKESRAANNTDGGERTLLEFLERKASKEKKVVIKKSLLLGDTVYILVSKDDASDILHLNGFSYAGANLNISESLEPWPIQPSASLSGEAQHTKDDLRNVLSARYDVNRKLLDLSNLGSDPTLVQMGIIQQTGQANLLEKAFKALLIVCDQQFNSAQAKRDSIPSISLAGNSISHVQQIFDLAETFPDLQNLDLSNNQIDSLRKLGRWRHRFRSLETLLLTGNPIEQAEPGYKTEILTWFPKLQILDGVQVRTLEEIQAAEAAARPTPIPQSGFDFRDAGGVGEQFIKQFFAMYDSDRPQLVSTFYDENSSFSIAVTMLSPHNPSTRVPSWQAYLKYSRNLTKITTEAAREQRLFVGGPVIGDVWKRLPVTRHPSIETDTAKYIIDCHVLSGLADPSGQSLQGVDGLIITVHGEFEELDATTNKTGMRGFTRSFVLGPGAPGKSPVRVISDMLSLRAHTPVPPVLQSLASSTTVPQAQPPAAIPAGTTGSEEVERKRAMVLELTRRTGMSIAYSERCLNEVNWDFDAALQAFERIKANLPPEAWEKFA